MYSENTYVRDLCRKSRQPKFPRLLNISRKTAKKGEEPTALWGQSNAKLTRLRIQTASRQGSVYVHAYLATRWSLGQWEALLFALQKNSFGLLPLVVAAFLSNDWDLRRCSSGNRTKNGCYYGNVWNLIYTLNITTYYNSLVTALIAATVAAHFDGLFCAWFDVSFLLTSWAVKIYLDLIYVSKAKIINFLIFQKLQFFA